MTNKKTNQKLPKRGILLVNREARHDFDLGEKYTAGVVLTGEEVKAIRAGRAQLTSAFARVELDRASKKPVLNLYGLNVMGKDTDHPVSLLLNKNELNHLIGATQGAHQTIVATRGYFKNNYFKIDLALAKRKKLYNRKQQLKERDLDRQAKRSLHK